LNRGFGVEAFLSEGVRNNPLSSLTALPRSSAGDIPVLSLYEELSLKYAER
jgi:hypothetical protein